MTIGIWESALGAGLLIMVIGWVHQLIRANQVEKDNRLKEAELKIYELDKADTKYAESIKRLHYRIDSVSDEQVKLERKIDKDIQEVKDGLNRISALLIKVLQRHGDSGEK